MTSQQFQEWFVDVLDLLYPVRERGMAAFMLTLPLLERCVRQRASSAPTDGFDDRCRQEMLALFPDLVDTGTAGAFWKAYRHGYLHQVTNAPFDNSQNALPTAALTHDITRAIKIQPGGFYVHPVLFSRVVVAAIKADYARFSGPGNSAPPLPTVAHHQPFSGQPWVLSTAGR